MRIESARRRWERYQFPPSFILGFHGCDEVVGEALLSGKISHLKLSDNDHDWLGTGIYFWEANPQRALEFALERAAGGRNSKGRIQTPFVVGAILDLGRCLDLRAASALQEVQASYEALRLATADANVTLPKNSGRELKMRKLDCAVMNFLHSQRADLGWPSYDTVRASFSEGGELYPDAGFREQDHIQICVREAHSILGYFRPVE